MKSYFSYFGSVFALAILFPVASQADHNWNPGGTQRNTLNDLLGRVTYIPVPSQRDLIVLSRIQEELVVFEKQMNGEGLPSPLKEAFSINYRAIRTSLVEDRISDDYGRDLLSVHRQLLDRTHAWLRQRNPNPEFGTEMIQNLYHFVSELQEKAIDPAAVNPSIQTPVINGYQVWLGELVAWACECNGLNAGLVSRLRVQIRNLEHFECLYKSDGVLYPNERDHLHKQFLKVTEETFRIIRRSY
ncbi:MAG: hypothetical protein P1U87_14320 [Verrucomicrobiales bacterium]|nr:hypothetical protein [Verrucomicrobiales bacterium]